MAVRTLAAAAAAVLLQATALRGQSATVEVTQSAGYSTFALRTHRYTAGARIRMLRALTLQLQLVPQPAELPPHRSTAFDVAIAYSVGRD
jgi:hypothetical protein